MLIHEILCEYHESSEFQRWFGHSKVVDARGKPLVVYHGTGGDFDAFNTGGGKGKTFGTGAFFSSNPATASTYAPGDGGNLKPVYLSLQHPVILDAGTRNWNRIGKRARIDLPAVTVSDQADEDLLAGLLDRPATPNAMKKLKARSTTLGRVFPDEMRYADDFMSTDDMARWAKSQGYDGLIIRNVADHGPSGMHSTSDARKPSDLYVAFHPQQIKSAIGNTGAFDSRNPNIGEGIVTEALRWKTPPLLYHCTLARNVPAILKQGLDPKRSRAQAYQSIFLAADLGKAEDYAHSQHSGEQGSYAILAIKLAALDKSLLEPDGDDLPDMLWDMGIHDSGAWKNYTWRQSLRIAGQCSYAGVVPPSAISVVKQID